MRSVPTGNPRVLGRISERTPVGDQIDVEGGRKPPYVPFRVKSLHVTCDVSSSGQ